MLLFLACRRLLAQVHDELLFQVDTTHCDISKVARSVAAIMTGQWQ